MKKTKINELADFFYSSDNAIDVPLRLAVTTGQYSGFDLTRETFINLMNILHNSKDLKTDLTVFMEEDEG